MTNAVEARHLSKSIEGSLILNDICMSRYMGTGYENITETLSMLGIAETGNKAVGKFFLGMK